MSVFLGIDSSNYVSSAALYNSASGELESRRRPLCVAKGSLGLRQQEAVFQHVKQLPQLLQGLFGKDVRPDAVGVSTRPCDEENSYMPCFAVGQGTAAAIAAVLNIPYYAFSHQAGHIAAALYGADRLELLRQSFLAFHLSGGTTQAVLVTPDEKTVFRCACVSSSLDLKAGQLVDRVGLLLGLPFPAGPALDALSESGKLPRPVRPVLRQGGFCLSGVENQCKALVTQGTAPADVALYALDCIGASVEALLCALMKEYGNLPVLFSGGVSSNRLLRRRIGAKYDAIFAAPAFSGDNAAGVAVLASVQKERGIACSRLS